MVLRIEGVTVRFPARTGIVAVDEVDLELPAGETLCVLGPSGCGKSTLLRTVAGLERPDAGRVLLEGRDLARVPTHKRDFALMFQDGQLFPHLSVADNIGYPLRLRHAPRRERTHRVSELLELVGAVGFEKRDISTLSGGERQRVALARALAVRPRLLLLDEPLSALDRDLRERLAGDLRRILTAESVPTLFVTHDHEEAFAVADRIAVMRAGRVVQDGPVSQVWRQPVDAETARFLGYANVLDEEDTKRLWASAVGDRSAPRAMALRRSALVVDDEGPLRGTIQATSLTADQARLVVRLDEPSGLRGIEDLDAVTEVDRAVRLGESVRLRLETSRIGAVGGETPVTEHETDTRE